MLSLLKYRFTKFWPEVSNLYVKIFWFSSSLSPKSFSVYIQHRIPFFLGEQLWIESQYIFEDDHVLYLEFIIVTENVRIASTIRTDVIHFTKTNFENFSPWALSWNNITLPARCPLEMRFFSVCLLFFELSLTGSRSV